MKKLFSILLFLALAATAVFAYGFNVSASYFAVAEGEAEEEPNGEAESGDETAPALEDIFAGVDLTSPNLAYEFFVAFVIAHADRTSGEEGEGFAAESLAGALAGMGYAPAGTGDSPYQPFKFTDPSSGMVKNSQNVLFTKNGTSDSGEKVIIGAHYDNLSSMKGSDGKVIGGEGAIDNATGVGSLLAAAYLLRDTEFKFDIVFALFGAELPGLHGSAYYLDKLGKAGRGKVLLMIDFNMIGGGDFLYLYTDETETAHGNLIKNAADAVGADLKLPPKNKNVMNILITESKIPYTHIGLMSDSANFIAADIKIAHFFGYNWEIKNVYDGRESANLPNVVYTSRDTLQNFEEYYKINGVKHMNDAVAATVAALKAEGFESAVKTDNAYDYSTLVNPTYIVIISACILAAVIIVLVLIGFYLKKHDGPEPTPPASAKNGGFYGNPFANFGGNNNAIEDPFGFNGAPPLEDPEEPFGEFD
ncbi:MAG: M28 family peptidase [Clostridiaceae bacterium]|nr:M28 family peptidase [Clostridiaceae bacterium]